MKKHTTTSPLLSSPKDTVLVLQQDQLNRLAAQIKDLTSDDVLALSQAVDRLVVEALLKRMQP